MFLSFAFSRSSTYLFFCAHFVLWIYLSDFLIHEFHASCLSYACCFSSIYAFVDLFYSLCIVHWFPYWYLVFIIIDFSFPTTVMDEISRYNFNHVQLRMRVVCNILIALNAVLHHTLSARSFFFKSLWLKTYSFCKQALYNHYS